MIGSCHCGAVSITLAHKPDYLHDCNCSLCTKAGALWGYFDRGGVVLAGSTKAYLRGDVDDPTVVLHFCDACGSTSHWLPAGDRIPTRMGVNMRLFDSVDLRGVELRFPDGRGWRNGTTFGYARQHAVFDDFGVTR